MYTDTLFNFSKIVDSHGLDEAKEILIRMAAHETFFALDSGIRSDDIWARADLLRKSLDLIEDETQKTRIKNMIYFSAGIMPDSDSVENRFEAVENLENTINDFKENDDLGSHLVAIGPCGIDHDWDSVEYEGRDHEYFDYNTIDDERNLFALQLTLGKKLDLPVIVHSRKGFKDTADVLKTVKWNKGIIHGFAYSQSELEFFLDMGWYISFSGTVTYGGKRNFNDISDLVAYVPKDRILVESDSPYYAPVPLKNVDNTPDNINYTYEYIASKRNVAMHKLSSIVDDNVEKLFRL